MEAELARKIVGSAIRDFMDWVAMHGGKIKLVKKKEVTAECVTKIRQFLGVNGFRPIDCQNPYFNWIEQCREAPSEPSRLPDGSGVFTGSIPLPKDHWLYTETPLNHDSDIPVSVLPICDQSDISAAVRWALRGVTSHGSLEDFDPDALVMCAVKALCGETGTAVVNDSAPKATAMKYDPQSGMPFYFSCEVADCRKWLGEVAWIYNPYSGKMRDPHDIYSDPKGLLIQP